MLRQLLTYSILMCLGTVISSCIDLGFQTPQPEGGIALDQFPDQLNGFYSDEEDTLQINFPYLILGTDTTELLLSDTTVLKKHKNIYFLNTKNTEYDYWTVLAFEIKKNRLTTYAPEIKEEELEKLQKHFGHIEPVYNDDGKLVAYVVSKNEGNWKRLLRKSFFSKKDMKKIE